MFDRFIRYVNKYFKLNEISQWMSDGRKRPLIQPKNIFWFIFLLFMSRLKSLNSMDELRKKKKHKKRLEALLGGLFPSADTVAYALKSFCNSKLREALHLVYTLLQRRHVIEKLRIGGYLILSLDGHELFCSRSIHCCSCLTRTLHTKNGDIKEYYHRIVVAQLVGGFICIPLDIEAILPGEDEVHAARRLFERVIKEYPKAFDVIAVDSLYLRASFVEMVKRHCKEIVCVIKDERRDLIVDARAVFKTQKPQVIFDNKNHYERWDEEDFTSWSQLNFPIRVVQSKEWKWKGKQLISSDWMWATTLSKDDASTEIICHIGHDRWDIENQGFNEAVTFYNIDRCFVHHPNAIEAIILIFALVYIVHKAFVFLNLKPAFRTMHSLHHIILRIMSDFFHSITHTSHRVLRM